MSKINVKVTVFSVIALACVVLGFFVSWYFIIPAVVLMILNQRELMKKKN